MGSSAYGGGVASYGALVPGPGAPPAVEYPNADAVDNGSTVENNSTPPQVGAPAPGSYQQPGTDAPSLDPQVDESTSLAMPGPNQIKAGATFIQANPNPADNAEIDASTATPGVGGGNPMDIGAGWQGNYIQPGS